LNASLSQRRNGRQESANRRVLRESRVLLDDARNAQPLQSGRADDTAKLAKGEWTLFSSAH
jgi:hypothetical protein